MPAGQVNAILATSFQNVFVNQCPLRLGIRSEQLPTPGQNWQRRRGVALLARNSA